MQFSCHSGDPEIHVRSSQTKRHPIRIVLQHSYSNRGEGVARGHNQKTKGDHTVRQKGVFSSFKRLHRKTLRNPWQHKLNRDKTLLFSIQFFSLEKSRWLGKTAMQVCDTCKYGIVLCRTSFVSYRSFSSAWTRLLPWRRGRSGESAARAARCEAVLRRCLLTTARAAADTAAAPSPQASPGGQTAACSAGEEPAGLGRGTLACSRRPGPAGSQTGVTAHGGLTMRARTPSPDRRQTPTLLRTAGTRSFEH